MSLTRWNPMSDFVSLRDAMDRLMSDSFVRPSDSLGFSSLINEMYEDDNEYVVKVSMPGIKPENVDLTVTGDVLTIHGRSSQENEQKPDEQKNVKYHVRQNAYSEYSQSVTLPGLVKADAATADCEHGIITIHLPKAEESRAKRIQINGRAQNQLSGGSNGTQNQSNVIEHQAQTENKA